ncbi:Extracellular dioxygenase [Aspergillus sclerotialis]|uniref:Extracellular dioxygenase n=1 Tax=Aspergillus sclerotialis TaxID=2070753 RepID=A0A3A2ZSV5_9EURO|nr:Extracellular dioxygenase [Aspergillus sclerotialis]
MHLSTIITALASLGSIVAAHPGHDIRAEAAERAAYMEGAPLQARSLSHCASSIKRRGMTNANIMRRQQAVRQLREARRLATHAPLLKARDIRGGLNSSHHSDKHVGPSTDPSELFESGGTCILGPDTTQGPYYVTGELIRKNIVEGQPGVPLYLDVQMIDTNTCEPVPNIYLDFWHCNATGVYSGVFGWGNGDPNDDSIIDKSFLRGLQKTDAAGVVQIETIFPGHYQGRAIHIHVLAHSLDETETNDNNTLADIYTAHASHVGQFFFDQDLINTVEETSPYSSNTQPLTMNADDIILLQEARMIDPFVEYVLLGDDISDGIFGWISMGLDGKENKEIPPAAFWTEDGGVENPKGGWFPPGPPGGGYPPSWD